MADLGAGLHRSRLRDGLGVGCERAADHRCRPLPRLRRADGPWRVPYRDFDVEYPPGALPVFVLPALVTGDLDRLHLVLAGLLAFVGAAVLLTDRTLVALGRTPPIDNGLVGPRPLAARAWSVAAGSLRPRSCRADDGALLAFLRGRPRLAGLVLGAAMAVKLYPIVILPVAPLGAVGGMGGARRIG